MTVIKHPAAPVKRDEIFEVAQSNFDDRYPMILLGYNDEGLPSFYFGANDGPRMLWLLEHVRGMILDFPTCLQSDSVVAMGDKADSDG